MRTRDDIAEMLLKRMSTIHKRAKEQLVEIQLGQRERSEKLIGTLDDVGKADGGETRCGHSMSPSNDYQPRKSPC